MYILKEFKTTSAYFISPCVVLIRCVLFEFAQFLIRHLH